MNDNRIVVFCIVLLVLVFASNFFLSCMAVNRVERARVGFELTEEKFVNAVGLSVSNYLAGVLPVVATSSSSSVTDVSPVVKVVPNLSTWLSPLRGYRCAFDGVEFGPGDYCEFGLILRVSSGRVYVRGEDDLIVLRSSGAADRGRPALDGRADGSAEDAPL